MRAGIKRNKMQRDKACRRTFRPNLSIIIGKVSSLKNAVQCKTVFTLAELKKSSVHGTDVTCASVTIVSSFICNPMQDPRKKAQM